MRKNELNIVLFTIVMLKSSQGKRTLTGTLDIGDTTAVFYNKNYRMYDSELGKVKDQGGYNAMIDQLPVIGGKYTPKNDLQIIVGNPKRLY